MQIDGRLTGETNIFETDICIIGAGAAGITIAKELISSGKDICLVESGGLTVTQENQGLASGENVGHEYFPLETTRLRAFGGTTGHWTGWCRPMEPIDFEKRDWVPDSGWPYGFDTLKPYYVRAQKIMQIGPYKYLPEEWESLSNEPWNFGQEKSNSNEIQSRIINRLVQHSPPTRFGEVYREELFAANNIRVFLNSNVTTINANKTGENINDITVRPIDGKAFSIKAKQFVLAASGLDNPRILLLSNNIHKNGLGNNNDNVGRYYMNHTWFAAAGIVSTIPSLSSAFYEYGKTIASSSKGQKTNVQGFIAFTPETQRKEKIINLSLVVEPGANLKWLITKPMENDSWHSRIGRAIANIDELAAKVLHDTFSDSSDYQVFSLINEIEQAPNPDSRVTLTDDIDILGQRKLRLDWQLQDLDIRSIARGHELLGAELARLGIGRVVGAMDPESGWPPGPLGNWHHIGTTRMSESQSKGVVDADCRVHGVNNLYIAGSSVFPTSGYCNPTLTIVALSIKLADHLKIQ